MRIESVTIKGFRSIEGNTLADCGGFNVLIGKNNSGKSNLLSAIDTFFVCIEGGNVVRLDPPVGRTIDFFERKTTSPIKITVTFVLPLAERDSLIRNIVTEAPQMKNAADGLDPSLRLSATVTVNPPPNRFSFVSKLALGGTIRAGAGHTDAEIILLNIGNEAASELCENLRLARKRTRDSDSVRNALRRFDEDDWQRFRGEPDAERRRPPLRYVLTRGHLGELSPELVDVVESFIRETTSYSEFERQVESFAARSDQEAASVAQKPLRNKIGTFAGEEASVPNYVKALLESIGKLKVLRLAERRKPIGKEDAERLLSLKVRRGGPEVLRSIQQTVESLLGVQIDAFESGSAARRGESGAELDIDNFLVEVNGAGIREALRLVLDVEFEGPNVLLVEEPEIHLHPSLETTMMRYLKRISSICQVFISTHSTNFLDMGEMSKVYLISKDRATNVQILDLEGAEREIPRELGLRLSSLFMYDRLVFVEGVSDEAMLREWASTLGVNLSLPNVGFVRTGGVRNFTHFATESTLSFLTKRQVGLWFLADRDERDEADIAHLRALLGDRAVVKVLEGRELENYLLCPRAIGEFIRLKRSLASTGDRREAEAPKEADITTKLNECAEKLKEMCVAKRMERILCKPVFAASKDIFAARGEGAIADRIGAEVQAMKTQLDERRARVDQVHREQCEILERVWRTDKLRIVPGKVLLDMVCREYGVRFKGETGDGSRLASIMNQGEIAEEIKAIIREIGS